MEIIIFGHLKISEMFNKYIQNYFPENISSQDYKLFEICLFFYYKSAENCLPLLKMFKLTFESYLLS